MKIIKRKYHATTGYYDSPPGVLVFNLVVNELEDGRVVSGPASNLHNQENEIQTGGDEKLRIEYAINEKKLNMLFLSDSDYTKIALRRRLLATKDLPLSLSDDFVRRWAALALGDANVISDGREAGVDYFGGGGGWGDIQTMEEKVNMLKHIKELPAKLRKELEQVENVHQFSAEYVMWRDTLKGQPITYKK